MLPAELATAAARSFGSGTHPGYPELPWGKQFGMAALPTSEVGMARTWSVRVPSWSSLCLLVLRRGIAILQMLIKKEGVVCIMIYTLL